MIVSSRYLFLGAACLAAATIVACGDNQAAPSTVPPPVSTPSPSPSPAPSPSPTPAPSVFTISGSVAETAPTTDRYLDGVRVSVGDKAVNTDSAGRFTLTDLPAGTYTVRAEKSNYAAQDISLTLPADAGKVLVFNIEPNQDTVNRERTGTIGPDNQPCHGGSLPCSRYDFPSHYAAEVTASLLWSSSDATLNLEMRCNGEPVSVTVSDGGQVARNGEEYLSLDLVGESQKGKTCEIRTLHVSGPEQKYTLVVSHTN